MPVLTMPDERAHASAMARFDGLARITPALLAHSAKEGREDIVERGMAAARVRGRTGLLSVSVAVLMMRGRCAGLRRESN